MNRRCEIGLCPATNPCMSACIHSVVVPLYFRIKQIKKITATALDVSHKRARHVCAAAAAQPGVLPPRFTLQILGAQSQFYFPPNAISGGISVNIYPERVR